MGINVSDAAVNDFINSTVTDNHLSDTEKLKIVDSLESRRFSADQFFDAFRAELMVHRFSILISTDVQAPATPEQRYDYYGRLKRKATIQVMPVAVKDFVAKIPNPTDVELRAFFENNKDRFSSPDSPDPGFKVPVKAKFQYFEADRPKIIAEEKKKVTNGQIIKYYDEHKEEFRKSPDDEAASLHDKTKPPAATAPGGKTGQPGKTTKTEPPASKTGGAAMKTPAGKETAKEPAKDSHAAKAAGSKDQAAPATTATTEKKDAQKKDAQKKDPEKKEAEKTGKADGEKKDTEKKGTDKKDADKADAEKKDSGKKDADKQDADKKDADKKDAGKKGTDEKDADKKDADKADAGKKSVQFLPSPRPHMTDTLLALADSDSPAPPTVPPTVPPHGDAAHPAVPAVPPAQKADQKAPSSTAADKSPVSKSKAAAPATPKSEAEPPTATPPKSAPGPAKSSPAKSSPAKSTPAKSTPAAAAKSAPAKTSGSGEDVLFPKFKPTDTIKKIPIVEYESVDSDKVRDRIKTDIATDRAEDRITEMFKKPSMKLSSYSIHFARWQAKQHGSAPTPPDYKALAKASGLELHETALVSQRQATDSTDLGKSYMFNASSGHLNPFAAEAFYVNLKLYNPYRSDAADGDHSYLWWRTEYAPAFVPKFEQVKKQVLDSWKMIEARKLARTQAKTYADEANQQHKELKELFQFKPNLQVSTIGPFSWLTLLPVARDPRQRPQVELTPLSGVDKAGNDFMHVVFHLHGGAAGVAMNEPQTIAYVVQAIDFEPAETLFRTSFLDQMAGPYRNAWMLGDETDARQANFAKLSAIEREFDVKAVMNADSSATADDYAD